MHFVVNEAELVQQARAGDVTALNALYREYVNRVFGLCLRMVGDRERAEELTQDTWVQVWRQLTSFRGEARFGTWLYRVAFNVVRQAERTERRRRQRIPLDRSPPATSLPARTERPDERVALERAIARLPDQARAVLVLHSIEGHTHAEIGRILGIAEGTSRAHLYQARERLRRELSE
jgi:RNA polymerase sigma-70 factor (ECF subfamily)